MQSETRKDQACCTKEAEKSKSASFPKTDTIEVTPEAKKKSLEAMSRGDEAFRKKDYQMAIDAYTQAIDLAPSEATLLSNRSLCWIRLGQGEYALADAKACRALRPDWVKACYREGAALRLLQRFDEAASAFYEGVKVDPNNKELVDAFRRRRKLLLNLVIWVYLPFDLRNFHCHPIFRLFCKCTLYWLG